MRGEGGVEVRGEGGVEVRGEGGMEVGVGVRGGSGGWGEGWK